MSSKKNGLKLQELMNLTETSKKSSQLVTEDNENKETAEDGGVENINASVDNTPKNMENMESDKADNAEENAPTCEIMVDIDLDMDDTDDTDDCCIEGMGPVEPYEKPGEEDEPVFSENDTDNPDPVEDKDKKNEDNKDNKNKFKIVIVKRKNAATGLIKQRDKEYEERRRKRNIAEPTEPTRQNATPDMDM